MFLQEIRYAEVTVEPCRHLRVTQKYYDIRFSQPSIRGRLGPTATPAQTPLVQGKHCDHGGPFSGEFVGHRGRGIGRSVPDMHLAAKIMPAKDGCHRIEVEVCAVIWSDKVREEKEGDEKLSVSIARFHWCAMGESLSPHSSPHNEHHTPSRPSFWESCLKWDFYCPSVVPTRNCRDAIDSLYVGVPLAIRSYLASSVMPVFLHAQPISAGTFARHTSQKHSGHHSIFNTLFSRTKRSPSTQSEPIPLFSASLHTLACAYTVATLVAAHPPPLSLPVVYSGQRWPPPYCCTLIASVPMPGLRG